LAQPNQGHYSPRHVNDRTDVNWPKVADPIIVEVSHPMHGKRDGQSQDRGDDARYSRPPETVADAVPGQTRYRDRGG